MPSPQPIPLNQIASAISDGSDKPVWAVDLTDIDNVVKDNPNIVHFDDPPTNLKPVIQAVGDAAQSTQDAIAAAPPVTGAGTSAANTAASSAAAASTSAAATASAAAAAAASAAAAAAAANAAAANAPGDAGLAAAASAANDAANSAYAAANVANTDAAAAAANAQQKAAQAAAATAADGNGLLAKLLGLGSSIWSTLKEMLTYTKDTRTADDAAITATGMPEQPAFGTYSGGKLDTSKLPIKKDIKSGLADFLSKSPSLNLIKSLVISTTESNSDMSFQFQGKTVTADFSHWNGILGGVGTSMLLIVHGLGLLIVFKRE